MKQFNRVYIEITNVCNLSCSFCIGNTRPPRVMSLQEFTRILDEVAPYTNHIYLHVLGEPLMHPELEQFLEQAARRNLRANITTNGTLLAKQQQMLLRAPALRKVSVSLHSMEKGSAHCNEEYLEQVAEFALVACEQGTLCELRLWNLGAEQTENETIFVPLCRLLGIGQAQQEELHTGLLQKGSVTLKKGLFLGKDEQFAWPSLAAPRTGHPVFCHGLRNQMAVLCDGTVVPCCLDSCGDIALGNLLQTSMPDILASARAVALHQGFSTRTPSEELCRRCGYATRF